MRGNSLPRTRTLNAIETELQHPATELHSDYSKSKTANTNFVTSNLCCPILIRIRLNTITNMKRVKI